MFLDSFMTVTHGQDFVSIRAFVPRRLWNRLRTLFYLSVAAFLFWCMVQLLHAFPDRLIIEDSESIRRDYPVEEWERIMDNE